jgi:hypothetical protein
VQFAPPLVMEELSPSQTTVMSTRDQALLGVTPKGCVCSACSCCRALWGWSVVSTRKQGKDCFRRWAMQAEHEST